MVAHASVASSKHKVELDSNADKCVVGDNSLFIHDRNRPVNVYSYNPKDGLMSAKTVNAAVGYQKTQWREFYLSDKPSYSHRWPRQPSAVSHAVLSE